MCKGWSLEIGMAFCGSVQRSDIPRHAELLDRLDQNKVLGEHLTRDIAVRQVEERIESDMKLMLHDWEL